MTDAYVIWIRGHTSGNGPYALKTGLATDRGYLAPLRNQYGKVYMFHTHIQATRFLTDVLVRDQAEKLIAQSLEAPDHD